MTKVRPALSFENALAKIAGLIGWDGCAQICGKSERALRKWGDADVQSHMRIDHALKLDSAYRAAGGAGAPIFDCYTLRLEIETAQACACSDELARATARVAKESGEALAALAMAARPGATEADRAIARREVEEASGACLTALTKLGTGERV